MKNIIKKILKENEDEFEWAHDLNTDDVEKRVKSGFIYTEDYGFSGSEFYEMLYNAGIRDANVLQEIGDKLNLEIQSVHERSYDDGRQAGRDDCDCDGCCDDYVWYEDYRHDVKVAREEGEEEGYERGYNEGYNDANRNES
jgi:hypothetical protein